VLKKICPIVMATESDLEKEIDTIREKLMKVQAQYNEKMNILELMEGLKTEKEKRELYNFVKFRETATYRKYTWMNKVNNFVLTMGDVKRIKKNGARTLVTDHNGKVFFLNKNNPSYIANNLPKRFRNCEGNVRYEYGDADVLFKVTPGFVKKAKAPLK
jgi:hypothetical protein